MTASNKHRASQQSAAPKRAEPRAAPAKRRFEDLSSEEVDELRRELVRKLVRLVNRRQWPACSLRACRRLRRCEAPDFACANEAPRRPITPEQEAAAKAQLWHGLRRRLAEIEREAR